MADFRIAVIGGGVSGLSASFFLKRFLSERNVRGEIHLFEKQNRLGGVIETREEDGFLMEAGPDAFISEKPWAIDLCKRLGIESELTGTQTEHRRSYVFRGGALHPVPEGFYLMAPARISPFVFSGMVPWTTKLRMLGELKIPPRKENADESVGAFMRRRFGDGSLTGIGQPMIGGIYMADPDALSLQATFPQFAELEKKYGSVIRGLLERRKSSAANVRQASGARYSLFMTPKKGLGSLVRTLEKELAHVKMHRGLGVKRIVRSQGQWQMTVQNEDVWRFDAVVLALPAIQASLLLQSCLPELSQELASIQYGSAVTLNLAYSSDQIRKPVRGFGFVVPARERKRLVACSMTHDKFAGRCPEGYWLLRAFAGGAFQPEINDLSDEQILHEVARDLEVMIGLKGAPHKVRINRYPSAMPRYAVGHLKIVDRIEQLAQKVPGLYLAGNGYRGLGIPDCVHSAEIAAKLCADFLLSQKNQMIKDLDIPKIIH